MPQDVLVDIINLLYQHMTYMTVSYMTFGGLECIN